MFGDNLWSVSFLNPDCEIADLPYLTGTHTAIYGYEGSTAQDYAPRYNYSFSAFSTYTLTYDANGGNNAPEAQAKAKRRNVKISENEPAFAGYTFTGWNTEPDGTGAAYAAGGKINASEDVTLYAQWTAAEIVASGTCGDNLT